MSAQTLSKILLSMQERVFDVNYRLFDKARLRYSCLSVMLILQTIVQILSIMSVSNRDLLDKIVLAILPFSIAFYIILTIMTYFLIHQLAIALWILHLCLMCSPILFLLCTFLVRISIQSNSIFSIVISACFLVYLFSIILVYHCIHFQFTFSFEKTLIKTSATSLLLNKLFATTIINICFVIGSSECKRLALLLLLANQLYQLFKCIYSNIYLVPMLRKLTSILHAIEINICIYETLSLFELGNSILLSNRWLFTCVLLYFQLIAYLNFHNYRILKLLLEDPKKIQSQANAELYLREFVRLQINEHKDGFCYMEGIINLHRSSCQDVDCVCHQLTLVYQIHAYYPSRFLVALISIFQNNMPQSKLIQYLSIYCKIEVEGLYPLSSYLLRKIQNNSHNLSYRWLRYDLRSRINKHIFEKFPNSQTQLSVFFSFQELVKQLKSLTRQIALKGIERLSLLSESVIDQEKMLTNLTQQLHKMVKVQSIFQKISKNKEARIIMFNFTMNILLDSVEANSILQNSSNKSKQNHPSSLDYNTDACIIEIDQTCDSLGTIINCSEKIYHLLGHRKQQIIGTKFINHLPELLENSFRLELENWFKTGYWVLFKQPRDSFALTLKELMISIKIGAKITVDRQRLRLFIWIKKNQKDSYGLLDAAGKICCLSSKIRQLCKTNQIYFQTICPKMDKIIHEINESWSTHDMHIIVPPANHYSILNRLYLHQNIPQNHVELKQYVSEFNRHMDRSKTIYLCRLNMKLLKLTDGTHCIVMKLMNLRLSTLASMLKQIPQGTQLRSLCSGYLSKISLKSMANIFKLTKQQIDEDINFCELIQFDSNITISSSDSEDNSSTFLKRNYTTKASVKGSIIQDFSFKTSMKQIQQNFRNPLPARVVQITIIIMLLICFTLMALLIIQTIIGTRGLASFEKILFADAAVSDNMQLLEMFHGKAILFHQYNPNLQPQIFNEVSNNSRNLANYLYELLQYNLQRLNIDISYDSRRYYQYLLYPINLQLANQTHNVLSSIFISQYYHAFIDILLSIQNRTFTINSESFSIIFQNWQALQLINHQNLFSYQAMSEDLSNSLLKSISLVIISYFFLSVYKVYTLYILDKRANRKLNGSLLLFEHITNQNLQTYRSRLSFYISSSRFSQSLKSFIGSNQNKNSMNRNTKRNVQIKKSYHRLLKYFLAFIMFNFSSLVNSTTILSFLKPCRDMMYTITSLMESENIQLQALFNLKTYYMYSNYNVSVEQFTSKFTQKYHQPQLKFIDVALDSLKVFGQYDSLYNTDFNGLLVNNICSIVQEGTDLDRNQINRCRNGFHTQLLNQGILGSMNCMHRAVMAASLSLQQNPSLAETLFRSPIFQDIDNSIFFMFKIYQLTQARMAAALSKAITDRNSVIETVTYMELLFLGLCILFWIRRYRFERQVEMIRFGCILLISPDIISDNAQIKMHISKKISFSTNE